jgi:hypothetical protein
MRIAFLASDKVREQHLADAFLMGARVYGHSTEVRSLGPDLPIGDYDVACMVGVKSRELFQAHRRAGVSVVLLDKGYSRHKRPDGVSGWEYWRVSVNSHHPTKRIADMRLAPDRLERLNLELAPWRTVGKTILFAGSSAKYHDFYGLREPNGYAQRVVKAGMNFTDLPWVYRPKPSWDGAEAFKGARFSTFPETLDEALADAFAMVTHGSNACFEAVLRGVPCIVLGDAVAKPISSTRIEDVADPRLASEDERLQWLANLAWHQWTLKEMASGEAWGFIGRELHS